MKWKEEIFDHLNCAVGTYEASLFTDASEQGDRYGAFMDRIPSTQKWPLALLEDLNVNQDRRKEGFGRKGLSKFEDCAKRRGAVLGLLKVGWGLTEVPDEARSWKTQFYSSAGWTELPRTNCEPVLMFKMI